MLDPDYLIDLFAPLGPVSVERMFGGQGIRYDGLMIALVMGDDIYLKASPETISAYEAAGSTPFSYENGKKRVVTSYWRLPDAAADDPDAFCEWGRQAHAAALRAAQKKPAKKSITGRR
ncbi:TfoX/Sxy family protein [Amorphus sp. 3PC139-8]|uniref:TfoX/Sxy family protein n=1 Tax=Amorphus sp. 3PC139-8 TaxID=2735676 RepID=UPI00345CF0EE